MKHIDQKLLKEILSYDPDSGLFTWNTRKEDSFFSNKHPERAFKIFNRLHSGKIAGCKVTSNHSKTSYINICINGVTFKAHRLAFIYMEGVAPEEVDHLDHDGTNNKWSNLRASNNKDNSKNLPLQKSNKTGVIGVNWHKAAKKWQARAVNQEGKRIDLGRFNSFDDAVNARKKYEVEFGYYENRESIK